MKKLHYLLFLSIIFLAPFVFAQEIDVTDYCYGTTGYPRMYSGEEIQYQTYQSYSFGTTYQFQLASISTELRYNLSANTEYTFILNAANDDFRNNFRIWRVYDQNDNNTDLVTGFTYVGYRKIQLTFKTNSATNNVRIIFGSGDVYSNITGEVNWTLQNAILIIPDSENQEIIDNNNGNTQDIINNNNSNTQDIINNNNENTDKQIESQIVCTTHIIDKTYGIIDGDLLSDGNVRTFGSDYTTTDYIEIYENSSIKGIESGQNTVRLCFYNSNKNFISCETQVNLGIISIPTNSKYFRMTINKSTNRPQIEYKYCKNGNQALNDSINDSNVDNDTGTSFFNDFTSEDFGLSQIITIPLNTIQSLTSKSCVPLQVPIPFTNSNITLPCMTQIYETKFPSIYNLWKIVSFGIIAYLISIDIFHIVKGFKDPESDKVEVLDL